MKRLPGLLTVTAGAAIAATLLSRRRINPRPILDENGNAVPGSLSEKTHVEINGARQGMIIRSQDVAKPVLLFLHGGPGLPEYFLEQNHPSGLDQLFTVCWWEQRGSGLSRDRGTPAASITQDQLVADTIEVTNYLRARFGHDKVYLMAHSAGTTIGIRAAAQAPGLFHAYIGVAQVTRQMESERLAHSHLLEQAMLSGETKLLRRLRRITLDDPASLPRPWRRIRDLAMHRMGVGTMHQMHSVARGILVPSLTNHEYSASEKLNLWRGKISRASSRMFSEILSTDIPALVPSIEVPAYFFHGRHDYTVSYPLAKQYFESLRAPQKGFYTFQESAHSPMFEEPDYCRKILQTDVLNGTTSLADI